MRRVLLLVAAGVASLSCEARQPAADQSATIPMGVEPSYPIARSSLAPPVGDASPPPLSNSPIPTVPYAQYPDEEAGSQPAESGWRASQQWAVVQGNGCIEVEPGASKVRVENCSKADAAEPTLARPEDSSGGY
jgi:hypothetical protein